MRLLATTSRPRWHCSIITTICRRERHTVVATAHQALMSLYYHYYTFVRNFPTLTIGNSNLKAETSDYFSFNAEYQTRKWTAGITTFVNNIHDMIVKTIVSVDADEVASLRRDFPEITDAQAITLTHYNRYDNSDRGRVYGLRAHFTVQPLDGLSLFANYSYILARQQSDGIWSNVERSIRNTVTLGADYIHRWGRYTLGLHADGRLQSKTYYPTPTRMHRDMGFGISPPRIPSASVAWR